MSYDVVIVGAGAAGCALAARLSADPQRQVLLLEAGPDERPGLVREPSRWPEGAGSGYDPGYVTPEQPAADARRLPLPRGQILGGSTAINAMIHALPRAEDLDGWGEGWAWEDLAPSLHEIEDHRGPRRDGGRGGPMTNGPVLQAHPLCQDFVTASVQSGYPLLSAVGEAAENGVGWFDLSVRDGERWDAAAAYLRPVLERPNLMVRTGARVTRIVVEDGRVVGVELLGQGAPEPLDLFGELVLCAGAIGSPAILLRSGIGPRRELEEAGIECRIDLPSVGSNLHDHPLVPVVWSSAAPVPAARNQLAESYLTFLSRHRGPRRRGPRLSVAFAHVAVPHPSLAATPHGATALVGLYQPGSRGRLRLDPADPTHSVLVDPGYLSDPEDVDALVAGVAVAREVARQPALDRWGLTELLPGPDVYDHDSVRAAVRSTVGSYGHLAGTCTIGTAGVVDAQLRVHGTSNLRIADASVIPTLPQVAPSATVQAIGWRAADLITRLGSPPGDRRGVAHL